MNNKYICTYNVSNFKQLLNAVLSRLEFIFSSRRLNLWKTFWVNFRSLPLRQAIQFPIFVYGKLKVVSLYGTIVIDAPIKKGMIQWGVKPFADLVISGRSVIENKGRITFKGETLINNGFLIIVSELGELIFGNGVVINNNLVIHAFDRIEIGDQTRITFNAKLMTFDFHYSIDTKSREVKVMQKPIRIGANNWITSDVKIMKGTVTPDWTIVVANSILNKDYTRSVPEHSIIGGQPARMIKEGQQRVFSLESENMLNEFFKTNKNTRFVLDEDIDLNTFCKR